MHATLAASMTLDGGLGIDHGKFFSMVDNPQLVSRDHRDHRKQRALGFPALGTAAGMVERRLCVDLDPHRVLRALAYQGAALEIVAAG
ncbi:hypothetical protein D3C84_1017970 [compost metagenome]